MNVKLQEKMDGKISAKLPGSEGWQESKDGGIRLVKKEIANKMINSAWWEYRLFWCCLKN